jgi:hypothetical protein
MSEVTATGPVIDFVSEQDGPAERRLKYELCRYFSTHTLVERAYLVVVRFRSEGPASVALALATAPERQQELVCGVQRIFHSMFNVSQALDLIFLSAAQEARLSPVCLSFFPAGQCDAA